MVIRHTRNDVMLTIVILALSVLAIIFVGRSTTAKPAPEPSHRNATPVQPSRH